MTKWYKQEKLRLRRKAQRAKLGLLRDLVIKPVTRRRYGAMVSRFFRWRKEKRLGAIRSEREMDQECARFLGYLWEEGEPKQKVYGCQIGFFSCSKIIAASYNKLLSSYAILA